MRVLDVQVPIYDWKLTFVTIFDKNDAETLKNYVHGNIKGFPEDELKRILKSVEHESYNGGVTITSLDKHRAVIVIYKWSNEDEFQKVLNHEKRHCVDNIVDSCRIEDSEAAAYLDGYISQAVYKNISQLK